MNADKWTAKEVEAIETWEQLSKAASILYIKNRQRNLTEDEIAQYDFIRTALEIAYDEMPQEVRDEWEKLGKE